MDGFAEIPGKGISAIIFMPDTLVGNAKLLKENGVNFVEFVKKVELLFMLLLTTYLLDI